MLASYSIKPGSICIDELVNLTPSGAIHSTERGEGYTEG